MAQQHQKRNDSVGFKTVQLLKDQTLGIGSYGKVCKAKCDDLLCAAKLIHETLFDPTAHQLIVPQREHRLPMRRFEQECDFLSTIRHPNIVQYLGIYRDPDTSLPALLMELMDDSLTHFLEGSTQPIPYHIQVNICLDITLALSFLHSNSIVHRDLSSNNVLLTGNAIRAKVTDFGMASLGDQNQRATQLTFTMCPGTDVYMPPEAVQDEPVYTEKIDCFSFGVITLQILTRQFPKPGNRSKEIEINQPGIPPGTVAKIPVPEMERRRNHISIIDPNHTLLHVSLDCLKDTDVERPSAQPLCERLSALKESPEYSESARDAEERNTVEQGRGDERDREIRSLRQRHTQQVQGLQQIIQSQVIRLEEKDQALREKDETIAAGQQRIREQRDEIGRLERDVEEKERQQQNEAQQLRREKIEAMTDKQKLEREKGRVIEEKERQLCQKDQALREKDVTIAAGQQRIRKQRDEYDRLETYVKEKERQQQNEAQRLRREKNEVMEDKESLKKEKNRVIEERERQMCRVNQQLEECRQVIAQFQRRIAELEQLRPATDATLSSKHQSNSSRARIKMTWREGRKAPRKMSSSYNAVADGTAVYVKDGYVAVYAFTTSTSSWSQLPDSPTSKCSSVIVNNLLTFVGGMHVYTITNQLFSLTGEGSGRRWTEKFPPMPTKRYNSTALCTGTTLIIVGGVSEYYSSPQIVEVMNTETLQWSTAAHLPQPVSCFPGAICGDRVYILSLESQFKYMYTCQVSALIQSCRSRPTADVWNKVAAPPVTKTTCVSILGRLLTIGGRDSNGKPTTAVYMYNPDSESWEVISHMATPRYDCCAAVLPNNQLMVVGGETGYGKTDLVELAAVMFCS